MTTGISTLGAGAFGVATGLEIVGGYVLAPVTGAGSVALAKTAMFYGNRTRKDADRLSNSISELFDDTNHGEVSLKRLLGKIPDKYKKKFKCQEYADKLEELMKEYGISGERVTVQSKTDYIDSERYGIISENGMHTGIKIGDTMYDNLNPEGIGYKEWLSDLGITELPWMFEIDTSPIS